MINFLSLMIACGMMPNVLVEVKILESLVNLDVMIFFNLGPNDGLCYELL